MSNGKTQSTLFDPARPGSNMPEFSVGEISKLLKKTVEDNFGQVRVRGEVSGYKAAPSGHVYFDLKDQDACLASVCWKGQVGKLGLRLENGMEIVVTGRLTTYMARSNYQLVVEQAALAGMGALLKLLEDRKKRLEAEGLFDPARKQLLPYLPDVIGVVTSPTGAVIRDILHRLADRFPRRVLIWPVVVQGEGAAQQIAAAIEGFNALPKSGPVPRPDLLIVARGGGSMEDLMPFNEEIVVRAAAASNIPLISAVGHETDTTLIDFASDVRAPTPTAAAEMAVPVRETLLAQLADDANRLRQCMRRALEERHEKLLYLGRALGDPAQALEPLLQRLDEKSERLLLAWRGYYDRRFSRMLEAAGKIRQPGDIIRLAEQNLSHLQHKIAGSWREFFVHRRNRIETLGAVLGNLSPKAVLGRGYALVHDASGRVVTDRTQAKTGEKIRIEFYNGSRGAVVQED